MISLENAVAEDDVDKGTFQQTPWTFRGRSANGRSFWLAVLLALLGAALSFVVLAKGRIASTRAEYALRDRALAALPLAADALEGNVEKQKLIPLILARDGAVQEMFRSPDHAKDSGLDDKLCGIARDAMASVVYVINTGGIAVAASNAGERTRFVGNDYRFRHYFTEAIAKGRATQYALGAAFNYP
ncbi:hypothetical protein ACD578_30175 (plasmid) [Microvirga sp. RSM25]|uniref:hypothetical protein n=1 Tax=Microvirga sp. RSM25 TaxID=3273802 RepID=UPI00384A6DAE